MYSMTNSGITNSNKSVSGQMKDIVQSLLAILLTVINCASWSFPRGLSGNPATQSAWSTNPRSGRGQTGCPTTAFGHDSGRHRNANKSANCARAEYSRRSDYPTTRLSDQIKEVVDESDA